MGATYEGMADESVCDPMEAIDRMKTAERKEMAKGKETAERKEPADRRRWKRPLKGSRSRCRPSSRSVVHAPKRSIIIV